MPDLPAIRPRIPRTLPVPADPDITEAALALYKERVERVVADTLESVQRKRAFVAFRAEDAEVRMIARSAARLAMGLDCNPDRLAREAQKDGGSS